MGKPIEQPPVPGAPAWLAGSLRDRWAELAPVFYRMGTLSELEAGTLARYILAENNYLQVSNYVQGAITAADPEDAAKWLLAQDRLTKQILTLGDELGLTPKARRARGLTAPR